jgi:CRP-like cAMP-binding protein
MPNRVSHSLVKALRHVPAFAALDEPTLLELVGCSANLNWGAGQVIFDVDDHAEALYVVLSGRVRIVEPEDQHVVATIGQGDYFGELSLMLDTKHSKTAITGTETELMVVPRESFQEILQTRPELEAFFRRQMESRLGLASVNS